MFGYMTEMEYVEMTGMKELEAEGDDLEGLLFHFLDEWLFLFSAEPYFIPRKVVITEFDLVNFKISAKGFGEMFDIEKHPQGTEVKAITYSAMQVYNDDEKKPTRALCHNRHLVTKLKTKTKSVDVNKLVKN